MKNTILLGFLAFIFALVLNPQARAASSTPPTQAGIASGTTITQQNWQRYQQFMSEGLIELFEGKHFWQIMGENPYQCASVPQ